MASSSRSSARAPTRGERTRGIPIRTRIPRHTRGSEVARFRVASGRRRRGEPRSDRAGPVRRRDRPSRGPAVPPAFGETLVRQRDTEAGVAGSPGSMSPSDSTVKPVQPPPAKQCSSVLPSAIRASFIRLGKSISSIRPACRWPISCPPGVNSTAPNRWRPTLTPGEAETVRTSRSSVSIVVLTVVLVIAISRRSENITRDSRRVGSRFSPRTGDERHTAHRSRV